MTKSKRTLSWRSRSQVGYYVGTLSITDRGTKHYNVFRVKGDTDRYYHVVQVGGEEATYYTFLGVQQEDELYQCTCPHSKRRGRGKPKPCRHVSALRSLVERGKIKAAKWQPVVLAPEGESK